MADNVALGEEPNDPAYGSLIGVADQHSNQRNNDWIDIDNTGHAPLPYNLLDRRSRDDRMGALFATPSLRFTENMTMSAQNLDSIRQGVLDRMERGDRLVKGAIIAAAVAEGLLLAVAVFIADWSNPLHRLVFVLSVLTYSVIACGLVALAGHISRSVGRVLIALESMSSR